MEVGSGRNAFFSLLEVLEQPFKCLVQRACDSLRKRRHFPLRHRVGHGDRLSYEQPDRGASQGKRHHADYGYEAEADPGEAHWGKAEGSQWN